MPNRRLLLAALAAAMALPAVAERKGKPISLQLTAPQIEALLSGNTIKGTWSGAAYSQYYSGTGKTVYMPEGGRPDEGRWRANAGTDQYESWWRSTGWTPYTVIATNDGFAWVNGETLEPFTVRQGKPDGW